MEDVNSIYDLIERYRILLSQVDVKLYIFFYFTAVLFFIFMIRLSILLKFQNSKSKLKHMTKADAIYLLGHLMFEFVISFVVCYIIIKLTLADPKNYVLNYIIAPSLGLIIAVLFDNIVIAKLEGRESITNNKKRNNENNSSNNSSSINININGSEHQIEENNSIINNNVDPGYINSEDIENEHFDQKVANAINEIKNVQILHTSQIEHNCEILSDLTTTVDIIRESQMNDKKIELKKMIYRCLDQGYATPEQNDIITTNYRSYKSLHGNGDIESLYKHHYLKLEIRSFKRRRIKNSNNTNSCEYGFYDNEYNEDSE